MYNVVPAGLSLNFTIKTLLLGAVDIPSKTLSYVVACTIAMRLVKCMVKGLLKSRFKSGLTLLEEKPSTVTDNR